MRASIVTAVVFTYVSQAHAGGGFIPPLEVDLGHAVIASSDGGQLSATEVLVGLSWASLWPRPTTIDFSLGWHGSFVDDAPLPRGVRTRTLTSTDSHTANGAFVAVELATLAGDHWRTWVGGRGELLGSQGKGVLGGAGRVAIELWHPVEVASRNAGIVGAIAIDAWAELGVRERIDRSLATVAAVGVGVRIPLMGAGSP